MFSDNINIDFIKSKVRAIVGEILSYYSGKEEVIRKILAAVLAGGHVLLEDKPGVGKTFLAKLMAKVLGLQFSRIQFTPDLLPSDIIGTKVWRPSEGRFVAMMGGPYLQTSS